jgi:transcriptional regulator with XRE-family HTH domain
MKKIKKENLEKKGWRIGSADEFLGLSPEESAFIDLKLSLSRFLQEKRVIRRLTQIQLAKLIESSQSRVAKMEKAEPSVSIDLILRSLFALGAETKEIARNLNGIKETRKRSNSKRIELATRGRHGARLRKRPAGTQ